MNEKDSIDYEEYKKRLTEYINQVESRKTLSDNKFALLTELDNLKQFLISKINKKYRNELLIRGFVVVVSELFSLREGSINSSEKACFQEEINSIYKFLYEELKKPGSNFPTTTPYEKNFPDIKDRRRLLRHIIGEFGEDNALEFYQAYPIRSLLLRSKKEWLGFNLFLIIGLIVTIGLASLIGYYAILFRNAY